jgi:hypothetical protein
MVAMVMGYFTTLWTTSLIAELCVWDGKRHIRYRDLAEVLLPISQARVGHLERENNDEEKHLPFYPRWIEYGMAVCCIKERQG